MNTQRWERAKEIFDAVLDLRPEVRASYLLQTCGGDAELRREVEDLLAADAEAGSFMNPGWLAPFSPFKPEPEFELAPGDVVSGRFKIVRPLGDGGMGRVYEAHDSVLGVQVALKTLRPEISANPEVLFRFRQEVRIAHRITHPNVCRTYHLDHEIRQTGADESSSVDLTFLTMEFLEGETLQQLLKREGRLPVARAAAIARQMAEAIEAAHQIGIVHRDIKPGNVMICPTSAGDEATARVVMTDFGLAKFEAGAPNNDVTSISQPGRAMGTLSYMSPEQLKGGEISCLTDIYAFGLVLYEMVTGVKAFPDSSTMETAYRRTVEPLPSPRAVLPELPREWEAAVLGCLQIEPADRFQHAMDAVDILEGSAPYSSRLRVLQRSKPVPRTGRRRRVALIGASVAGVALSAIGLRYFMARGDSAVAAGALVYLAPVKNETGEKQLDNVTELVKAGLEQSAHINLLDAGRVGDILQQMTKPPDAAIDEATAREIAMRAGAARVVFATVSGSDGTYRLDIDIQQPDNIPSRYRNHWPHSWSWQSAPASITVSPNLLHAVREAEDWSRHTVGESSNDIARLDVPSADVTTGNWQALVEYTSGERLSTEGKAEDAILAFRAATTQDPDFALAYARQGDKLISLNRFIEGYDAYNRALRSDLNHRLTRRERDFIKGAYASDTGDYATAEAAFRDYAAFYENDYFGTFFRAYPLRMMGRSVEAVAVLNRAHELMPSAGGALIGLAYNSMLLRDFSATHKAIDGLSKLNRKDDAAMLAGHVDFLEGKPREARTEFDALKDSAAPDLRSRGYDLRARLAAEYGSFDEALREIDAGIEADHTRNDRELEDSKLLDRAYIKCHLKEYPACFADVHKATSLSSRPDHLTRAGSILGTGVADLHLDTALRKAFTLELKSLHGKLPLQDYGVFFQLARLRLEGELLLAQDKPREALAAFRMADTLDSPITDREYLSRALIAAAATAKSPIEANSFLDEALALRERIATNPPLIWNFSPSYPPGFLADEMRGALDLAARLHRNDHSTEQILSAYQALRPNPLKDPVLSPGDMHHAMSHTTPKASQNPKTV